jgi:hypothetical protein
LSLLLDGCDDDEPIRDATGDADALLGLPGFRVLSVDQPQG